VIALSRDRTAIPKGFSGEAKKKRERKLLLEYRDVLLGKKAKLEWDSKFWGAAKAQLIAESSDKCAYCETNFRTVSFGDVEHYRPKSLYWWLAYCLENYLASCQICNQAMKRDAFPRQSGAKTMPAPKLKASTTDAALDKLLGKTYPDSSDTAAVRLLETAHRKEKALLLNPYLEDPSAFLVWHVDDTLREVEVRPKANVAQAHLAAMEEFYGINRLELKKARYKVFLAWKVATHALRSPDTSLHADAQALLDSLHQPTQEYLGMIHHLEQF
jgi:hypothetical protein